MNHFVLFDDAVQGSATMLSTLVSVDRVTFDDLDAALHTGWQQGWHCFAWIPYDTGDPAPPSSEIVGYAALYWFAQCAEVSAEEFLASAQSGWLREIRTNLTQQSYQRTVGTIQEAIKAGTTYQVNYTHTMQAQLVGDPIGLYRELRRCQPVPFGVLARLPEPAAQWTLSLSPELFIAVDSSTIISRPMKGTLSAEKSPDGLRHDAKNRAENLMIVDLIRNDLNQVAVPGSVSVPGLFEIDRVGSLWQMSSTVRATLRPGCSVAEVLRATFPCGSITGAPKLASMQLIQALEDGPRGLYTGALGWIKPAPEGSWSACLSVVIRTLEIDRTHHVRMGIGSGIVADSDPVAEWQECRAKAGFVTNLQPDLELIETFKVIDGQAPLLEQHLQRLAQAAADFAFPFPDLAELNSQLQQLTSGLWRVRLTLDARGTYRLVPTRLEQLPEQVEVVISQEAWPSNALARYKSTARAHLDHAWQSAISCGAYDMLGWDSQGYVLEGGRTNVFAQIDGQWLTPPLALGILAGVQRSQVLANPRLIGADQISEQTFTVADLLRADALYLTNAIIGAVPAQLRPMT